jgi:hypothetical protein
MAEVEAWNGQPADQETGGMREDLHSASDRDAATKLPLHDKHVAIHVPAAGQHAACSRGDNKY